MPLSIATQLRAGHGQQAGRLDRRMRPPIVVSSPQGWWKNQVMAEPWTLVTAWCSGAQPTIYRLAGIRGLTGNFQRYVNGLQQHKGVLGPAWDVTVAVYSSSR